MHYARWVDRCSLYIAPAQAVRTQSFTHIATVADLALVLASPSAMRLA
ncbi:hypothetical protein PSO31014_00041 [Pandoraea soli]|uniref:Uncharacterized protein n=1 Tax=Pandoraea soli TaxID=2508293 RepID=A0ABY6VKX5_9BURK|nr:hypothetical protein PSO31014_00041 [Pandoraea soli]